MNYKTKLFVSLLFLLITSGFINANCIITRVSLSENGTEPNNTSYDPALSSDGKYFTFFSLANNIVPNDTNQSVDIFMYNAITSEITKISNAQGVLSPNTISTPMGSDISENGDFVVFSTYSNDYGIPDTNGLSDIYLYNRDQDSYEIISLAQDGSQGNGICYSPEISDDGRFIAFVSSSTNLISGTSNYGLGIYFYDRYLQTIFRVASGDSLSLSSDGTFIAFSSPDTNLVPNDTNGRYDIFVRNLITDNIVRASVNNVGVQGNNDSYNPSISNNGTNVVFQSDATNLVAPDSGATDIFLHNLISKETILLSTSVQGIKGNRSSYNPKISGDGRYVVFQSYATNLVDDDKNNYCGISFLENCADIFYRNLETGEIIRASMTYNGNETNSNSYNPKISRNGDVVVFESEAFNIISNDNNGQKDIYSIRNFTGFKSFLPVILR